MRISSRVISRGDRWESKTFVENLRGNSHPFHDVVLRSFDNGGEELEVVSIGAIPTPDDRRVVEIQFETEEFPAIQTATAQQSPCDKVEIEMVYWTGSDDQRNEGPNDHGAPWQSTTRRCNESVPPERVVERARQAGLKADP
jgi:hypothetical protein